MNTTLSDQIKAIQDARAKLKDSYINIGDLDAALNDAGSSLAALNLNPDREKRIKELEEMIEIIHEYSRNAQTEMHAMNGLKRIGAVISADVNWNAATSRFASADELTKTKWRLALLS